METNHIMSSKQLSERALAMSKQSEEDNKEYLDMLNDTAARQQYFSNLAKPDDADHAEIASVKARINKLIQ